MGKAICKNIRERIIEDYCSGKSCKELSLTYNISYKSVLRFCKAYKLEGISALNNDYVNCGSTAIKFDVLIYRSICWLKYLHPKWGAAYILLQIEKRHGSTYKLPSERTVQFWFVQKGYHRRKLSNRPPQFPTHKAKSVHDIWQIDAKEKVKLGNDTFVCWLTITDEYSCALLQAPVFPPHKNFTT